MLPQTRRTTSRPATAQLVEPPVSLHPPGPPTRHTSGPPTHHTPGPPTHTQPTSTDGVLIVYHLGELPTPFAKRVSSSQITLGEFKVKIFAKNPGEYRFVLDHGMHMFVVYDIGFAIKGFCFCSG